MNRQPNKKTKRVRDRIYRISFRCKDGVYREPEKKFETYRRVLLNGHKKREAQCFASIEEAEVFRDSRNIDVTPRAKGKLLREVVADYKAYKRSSVQRSTFENVLNAFPDDDAREKRKRLGKPAIWPLDFLMDDEVDSIGPKRIDELLVHMKRPEFVATLKAAKTNFKRELKYLKEALEHYASRENRDYRLPFLKDHWKNAKIKDAPPKKPKDLPAEKLGAFLEAIEHYCAGGPYEYVMAKMAEVQYRTYARIQEAAAIHLEDGNTSTGETTVRRRVIFLKKPKPCEKKAFLDRGAKANGGKILPPSEVPKILLEIAMRRGIRSGPLFFVNDEPIPYKAIQNAYDAAHRAAGTGMTGSHVLRHGSLTEFYEASKDLKQTAKIGGQTSVKTVERYAKARDKAVSQSQRIVEEKLRSLHGVR